MGKSTAPTLLMSGNASVSDFPSSRTFFFNAFRIFRLVHLMSFGERIPHVPSSELCSSCNRQCSPVCKSCTEIVYHSFLLRLEGLSGDILYTHIDENNSEFRFSSPHTVSIFDPVYEQNLPVRVHLFSGIRLRKQYSGYAQGSKLCCVAQLEKKYNSCTSFM